MLLMVHPSVPAKDLKEFVAVAQVGEGPDVLRFDRARQRDELFRRIAEARRADQARSCAVPRRGTAGAELLSGRIQFGGDQLSTSLQHAKSGALRPLAVQSATRSPALPDVPTVREQGFAFLELQGWNGFFAPAGTPDAIVQRLHKEIVAASKNPDVRARMEMVGAEPGGSTQDEMRAMLREQVCQGEAGDRGPEADRAVGSDQATILRRPASGTEALDSPCAG